MTIKVIENAGSLSENDLKLIAGTDLVLKMMRNRILLYVNKSTDEINWEDLTAGVEGFYHIRTVDQKRLFQVWFEKVSDYEKFRKNLFVTKIGADAN